MDRGPIRRMTHFDQLGIARRDGVIKPGEPDHVSLVELGRARGRVVTEGGP